MRCVPERGFLGQNGGAEKTKRQKSEKLSMSRIDWNNFHWGYLSEGTLSIQDSDKVNGLPRLPT